MVDALTVHDLEFCLPERRRYLVLDDFYAGFVAHHLVAVFHRTDTANIKAHRGVEFQGVTTGGGLGATEHNANLHTDLVDEHHQAIGVLHITGKLAQCL